MTFIALATEDELSERIGSRLCRDAGLTVSVHLRKGGFGYLRSRISNFCAMARNHPLLLLTDLDRAACARGLIEDWTGDVVLPENFLFRVCVREVESWLLADSVAIQELLGCREQHVPIEPDQLADPKSALLNLARRAPRNVRDDLVAAQGAVSSQGIGYNARLGLFVENNWSSERAAQRSPSLRRTLRRIGGLALRLGAECG